MIGRDAVPVGTDGDVQRLEDMDWDADNLIEEDSIEAYEAELAIVRAAEEGHFVGSARMEGMKHQLFHELRLTALAPPL